MTDDSTGEEHVRSQQNTQEDEGLDYTGTSGMDIVPGTEHDDTIETLGGTDVVAGGAGNDFLFGDSGADTFVFAPGHGSDTITDFDTDDDISFDDLTITATTDGTGSIITVTGDTAADNVTITLQGVATTDVTADIFEFDDAPDLGSNVLGTEGDDNLSGTQVSGGEGDDTFVIAAGQTLTTIYDFTDGDDTIDLSNFSSITAFSGLTITADGDAAVIDLSSQGAGSVRLENVAVSDLDADDFVFASATTDAGDGI